MSTEKRSIEISYKANLKDLVSKLKTLPNVTSQEAKAMVQALDKQLKQAEKAAKRAAEAQKKAAQAGSAAFKNAQGSVRGLNEAAEESADKLGAVAESAGDADRGFAAMGMALGHVNPALGEAAMLGADVFAVSEGLLLTLKALNPMWLAGAAALAVVTLGYASYQQSVQEAKQLTLDLREALKSIQDEYKNTADNIKDSIDKLYDQKDAYEELTGQISKFDAAVRKTTRSVEQQFQGNIEAQEAIIQGREEDLQLIARLQRGNAVLSDEEKARLRTLQLQTKLADNKLDLTSAGIRQEAALGQIEASLTNELATQQGILVQINNNRTEAVSLAVEQLALQKELEDAQAEEAKKEAEKARRRAAGAAWAAKRDAAQQKLNALIVAGMTTEERITHEYEKQQIELDNIEKRYKTKVTGLAEARLALEKKYLEELEAIREKEFEDELDRAEKEVEDIIAKAEATRESANYIEQLRRTDHQKELDRIQEKYDKEFMQLQKLALNSGDYQQFKLNSIALEEERNKEFHQAEMKRIKERVNELKGTFTVFTQQLSLISKGVETYLVNTDRATEESAKKIFRLNQAAALAQIAFNTAANISKYAGTGPAAPFLIAGVVAAGAAQSAAVLSQQPPSMHMGGLAPDETTATLLRGEAVLDRRTTAALGEEGVRQLQNGAMAPEVVILQPFKHFDRYNRSARKRIARPIGSARY
jgi:DNA repair exonuclease SbcCD ATPase subunit